ncbi:ankyrin [Fomitiporia mediterranea MF3/22]|uniref:ankyrin n=1 Tax=Fomitiporia mediterranea (strain MF3/22) TaxID=694068 RepID=UPI0004408919|nr:ankyrin [Fomitiporia mediterranea MF3/22]EJD02236.1 ankyrin [Fomitiporia mediterranea MF3/22]
MSTNEASQQPATSDHIVSSLPQETLDFAGKVFNLARSGGDELLSAYLDAGLPPNLTNEKGNTLIMLAAYNGHASTVRVLHIKGADPNRLNDRGQSPLAGAIFKNEEEVVRTLAELGADPRAGTPNAIDTAKIFRKSEWLDLLGATEEERNAPVPDAFGLGPG